jgi:integrase/recombinase XerD
MLRTEYRRWMQEVKHYSPVTIKARDSHMGTADAWMHRTFGRRLIRAQQEHIETYLRGAPTATTRNSYLADFRSYFAFAIARGYRKTDPTKGIERWKMRRRLPRPISLQEAQRLRAAASSLSLKHRTVVEVALHCGPRRAEIAGLRWEDIDFGERRIRFDGKTGEGVIPLHENAAAVLQAWRLAVPSSEWVFPSPRGGHYVPKTIWQYIQEASRAAALRGCTPHRLRHTFATKLLDAGVDVRHVQELMRHASLSSTALYTKVSVANLEPDINRLDYGS